MRLQLTIKSDLSYEYDGRSGRRWNTDPRPVTSISPYATFQGNPIMYSDPYGDTIKHAGIAEADAYKDYRNKVFGDDK